jgi:hypothetical protein
LAVGSLAICAILFGCEILLIFVVGLAALLQSHQAATRRAAIALTAVTRAAEIENSAALRPPTEPLTKFDRHVARVAPKGGTRQRAPIMAA